MRVSKDGEQGRGVRHRLPPPDRPGHVADRHPHRGRPGRELDAGARGSTSTSRAASTATCGRTTATTPPKTYDPPLCWLPREVDNSAGGQVWVPDEHVRPARRAAAAPLLRPLQGVRAAAPGGRTGVVQGGVASIWALKFLSGVCRGRFGPRRPSLRLRAQRLADGGAGRRLPAARALHRPAARRTRRDGGRRATRSGSRSAARWTRRRSATAEQLPRRRGGTTTGAASTARSGGRCRTRRRRDRTSSARGPRSYSPTAGRWR